MRVETDPGFAGRTRSSSPGVPIAKSVSATRRAATGSSVLGGTCVLFLLSCVGSVSAQPPQPEPASSQGQTTSGTPALPQITVQARREAIQKQAQTFVKKVTGSAWMSDSGERILGLWRKPVCPLVAGLAREQGQIVFDRLTEVITAAGAPPGSRGCRPNLVVVVTTRPEELLSAWYKRDIRMFAQSMPAVVKKFFGQPLPVRLWYSTMLVSEDRAGAGVGSVGSTTGGAQGLLSLLDDIPTFRGMTGDRLGSRLGLGAVHDLSAVIAIVDFSQMVGITLGQIADYVGMSTLTNIDPYASFDGMPSILALFSTASENRPNGLTAWDSAFLKALYHTDRMSPLQRMMIAEKIARDLDPDRH